VKKNDIVGIYVDESKCCLQGQKNFDNLKLRYVGYGKSLFVRVLCLKLFRIDAILEP
jgi:hypothetical protein